MCVQGDFAMGSAYVKAFMYASNLIMSKNSFYKVIGDYPPT